VKLPVVESNFGMKGKSSRVARNVSLKEHTARLTLEPFNHAALFGSVKAIHLKTMPSGSVF